MHKILFASTNKGKRIEVIELFKAFPAFCGISRQPISLLAPGDVGEPLDVIEDGKTYAENAVKKALAYTQAYRMLAIADDSGLEVDALNGRPGIQSARYAGTDAGLSADDDTARRRALLRELRACARPWYARFRCVMAIALPDGEVYTSEGSCEGEIVAERGAGGFGYDPIFQVRDARFGSRTMAELTLVEKNTISHRAAAVRGAFPILKDLLC